MFPGKSFFSAHEVSTCKISGCLSYRILDSGPDGTQTTLTIVYRLAYIKKSGNRLSRCPDFVINYNTQSLALKHTYEVYFGYERTLRKYGRFRQKLPVKTGIRKNSARRRPVTGQSPRTGEEAQYICSYSEQVRPEAFIIGSVCCFSGMIYPHIQRPDPINRSMNDQQRIH